ncbi:hypothetical protein PQC07_gp124 [Aeromonas phage D3]|uniref:Uncharacterized protein n=2 Tax=Ludhianavirus TaxID=3044751 RepID=A0A514TVU4_9CAUD|nr:hypothetical protein PQC07_gp124 [Aeromonas phage D3]YP_010668900.1 hypothetical protein PQC08_gp123 [Aeromonas phage D6]QDJ97149.1 hypothetical protein D3_0151 [Aeromonas phage D3]QDJ97312.1 hypothetical protein D6_0152 [Aeromonas phage D6]QEP52457.1 hypothetical protein D9_0250 [Aeromonas phage D9]
MLIAGVISIMIALAFFIDIVGLIKSGNIGSELGWLILGGFSMGLIGIKLLDEV